MICSLNMRSWLFRDLEIIYGEISAYLVVSQTSSLAELHLCPVGEGIMEAADIPHGYSAGLQN